LQYKKEEIRIKEWNSYKDSKKSTEFKDQLLLATTKDNSSSYIGLINQNLEKTSIGIQTYSNGDVYIGQWEGNKRHGLGAYMYEVEKKGQNRVIEIVMSDWRHGAKEKEGAYVWVEEDEKNNELDFSNFEAYIGEIEHDQFKRGIILSKIKMNICKIIIIEAIQ
jgi:hypothetical protein